MSKPGVGRPRLGSGEAPPAPLASVEVAQPQPLLLSLPGLPSWLSVLFPSHKDIVAGVGTPKPRTISPRDP